MEEFLNLFVFLSEERAEVNGLFLRLGADPPKSTGAVDFGNGLKLCARAAKDIRPENVQRWVWT